MTQTSDANTKKRLATRRKYGDHQVLPTWHNLTPTEKSFVITARGRAAARSLLAQDAVAWADAKKRAAVGLAAASKTPPLRRIEVCIVRRLRLKAEAIHTLGQAEFNKQGQPYSLKWLAGLAKIGSEKRLGEMENGQRNPKPLIEWWQTQGRWAA